MRNIFLFIRRYFNFLLFLLLQVLSIYFIVHYSKYHQAMFGSTANRITGKVNSEYNKIEYYFQLKRTNDSLVKANEALYNKLKADFNLPDTVSKTVVDTMKIDSITQYRTLNYLNAKVVSNSVNFKNNYIVIAGANVKKFKPSMGIIDVNNNAVGVITEVSGDYAVVMSMLHKDSKINGKLMKTGETGTVTWDGTSPNILTLSGIPKSAKIVKGDSVITSGFSTYFPKGILIGRIDEINSEKSTSNYTIKLRSSADFYNLQYVYAIINYQQEEINKLLDKQTKQN
ncbi:rod shape-determining protein MreC [Ferruginibacter sp. HRS2-29]|uniref:rod shape-determining protein MreC n=1 Tax=Ferruginibacter sp. HRS2-29 TaxID=2487334 RepID=UPI0020CDF8C4